MSKEEIVIMSLNELTNVCGYFNSESIVNNGYGCNHKQCEDRVLLSKKTNENQCSADVIIAKSFSKNKITSRRLAKKFIKRTRLLSDEEKEKILNEKGYYYHGRCFSFSCPIAWEVDFDSIGNYNNSKDYDCITNESEMPEGWGDDLMGVDLKTITNN